uniref:AlNc14C470G11832 protein n=1 Tax=Albugo laibachii Nc14 TaxID=890382 RepID=F0X094_9STRA|nr:AlNc14C470G11832 [Albugo laibachii Nc14]|eukprot:CCA27176.1 AlNc14C470G11832 [Albugo laibachii Nc14]
MVSVGTLRNCIEILFAVLIESFDTRYYRLITQQLLRQGMTANKEYRNMEQLKMFAGSPNGFESCDFII